MFLTATKTLFTEVTQAVFGPEHPTFPGIWVGQEYPEAEANYPGIWIDFTPTTALQVAGIGHYEYADLGSGLSRRFTRWRFAGSVSFTVVALTSLERDRLVDEMTRVLAFGTESPGLSTFRSTLEANDLIHVALQWDTFSLVGKAEDSGTPWGSDDLVYEMTVTVDLYGDFVSDLSDNAVLIPLSKITITERTEDEPAGAMGSFLPPTALPVQLRDAAAPQDEAYDPANPPGGLFPENTGWH